MASEVAPDTAPAGPPGEALTGVHDKQKKPQGVMYSECCALQQQQQQQQQQLCIVMV
jgi:hypothetical protein